MRSRRCGLRTVAKRDVLFFFFLSFVETWAIVIWVFPRLIYNVLPTELGRLFGPCRITLGRVDLTTHSLKLTGRNSASLKGLCGWYSLLLLQGGSRIAQSWHELFGSCCYLFGFPSAGFQITRWIPSHMDDKRTQAGEEVSVWVGCTVLCARLPTERKTHSGSAPELGKLLSFPNLSFLFHKIGIPVLLLGQECQD